MRNDIGRTPEEPTLDEQIEKDQEKVFQPAETYNKAVAELKDLMDEKDKNRKDLFLEAVANSKCSYEGSSFRAIRM